MRHFLAAMLVVVAAAAAVGRPDVQRPRPAAAAAAAVDHTDEIVVAATPSRDRRLFRSGPPRELSVRQSRRLRARIFSNSCRGTWSPDSGDPAATNAPPAAGAVLARSRVVAFPGLVRAGPDPRGV